jgi:hypothetical protein
MYIKGEGDGGDWDTFSMLGGLLQHMDSSGTMGVITSDSEANSDV